MPPGTYRRSYVLWQERIPPQVVLEFVSGDGSEERDQTPETGKFWVYEQAIRAAYYGIFDSERNLFEMYQLVQGRYRRTGPNANGRYLLPPLGVEIGVWNGHFAAMTLPWLRWWDAQGNMLLTGHEIAELEREAQEQEREAKEQARRQTRKGGPGEGGGGATDARRTPGQRKARREAEAGRPRAKRLAEKLRALGVDPDA